MRLVELFLRETTEEDRAIISLAGPIFDLLQKYADIDVDFEDEDEESQIVGKIGDFFHTPFIGIDNITLEIQSDAALLARVKRADPDATDAPAGLWDANVKTIILNSDYLSSLTMKTTIAHELRHALDDVKSDYKVASSSKYATPKDKAHRTKHKDPYIPNMAYLAQPAEINARFIQVLQSLVPKIARVSNQPSARDKMHKALKYEMEMHDVAGMFRDKTNSSDYKRLLKRAADFIDKELAHTKGNK